MEGGENNLWAEGLEGENDSSGRGRSHFLCRHKYGEEVLETENIVRAGASGLGRFVQPAWLESPS